MDDQRKRVKKNKGRSDKWTSKRIITKIIQTIVIVFTCTFLLIIINDDWLRRGQIRATMVLADKLNATPLATLQPKTPEPTVTAEPLVTAEPTIEPSPTPRPISSKFFDLLDENPETVGWISIEDTVLNYPVVQDLDDNEHYLHVDFYGNDSKWGTIYLNSATNFEPLGRNIIIYGHRMKDGTMFKPLIYYNKKSFYDEHKIIEFNTIYEDMEWEIFSMHIAQHYEVAITDDNFKSDAEWLDFITGLQDISIHDTSNIELQEDDIVITLITCTYEFDDARFVVHARLKKD